MSYAISLTNSTDIGNNITEFTCQLADPIVVKRNSYIQINNAYIEKTNNQNNPDGVFLYIKEFSSCNTYMCNKNHNSAKCGMIGHITSFPGFGIQMDDLLFYNVSSPKIPINNGQDLILNNLNVELRDREGNILNGAGINNVIVQIFISDNPILMG
jgi:hypothetical protein